MNTISQTTAATTLTNTTPTSLVVDTSTTPSDPAPKRVILRIRPIPGKPNEVNNYLDYIYAFLRYCGPERWDPTTSHCKRHYDHIQGHSAVETWHIILDMEKDKFSGSDFDQLPHEVYRVERRQTGMYDILAPKVSHTDSDNYQDSDHVAFPK